MKKYFLLSMIAVSFNVMAVDTDKYCLPYLNGSLDPQAKKPEIMEGFSAKKEKMEVSGSIVESIAIVPDDLESKGDVKTTQFPWGEEVETTILKYKKNGKQVKDYKMIVSRDKAGNLISIRKKPILLQDFKLHSDTLYLKVQKDTCIPEKYIADRKLNFSVDLCRELDRFFAENPTAKACLDARHDQKLASLIKEHAKGLPEKVILGLEKNNEDMAPLYAAKHRIDCSEAGVDGIVNDKVIWGNYVGKRGEEKVKGSSGDQE
jgi:hypothetical protein